MAIVGMGGLQSCARILLPEDERKQILRKMRNPRIEVLQRRAVLKKVIDRCKRVCNCLWCEWSESGYLSLLTLHQFLFQKRDAHLFSSKLCRNLIVWAVMQLRRDCLNL
jgi:hypothetical protein